MARFARVVLTDIPYHLTHRGNRRDDVFFTPADRDQYRQWLRQYADRYGLEIWAYCLMTNHVHLIATPRRPDAMAQAIGRAHMRHARHADRSQAWSGHLWANRFYSTALDEADEKLIRANTYTGRPTGGEDFVTRLEQFLGRPLRPQKRGRKARKSGE